MDWQINIENLVSMSTSQVSLHARGKTQGLVMICFACSTFSRACHIIGKTINIGNGGTDLYMDHQGPCQKRIDMFGRSRVNMYIAE